MSRLDHPLAFTSLLKTRVWGGQALKRLVAAPPADPVGESWEVVDRDDDASVVENGPHAGRTLRELFRADREALCGSAVDPANPGVFPLLLKLLDASEDLSIQVHPDDAMAARLRPGELGKTEAWVVLEAARGARIYRGFRPGVTKETFAAALAAPIPAGGPDPVAACLQAIEAAPGMVLHLPAGMIHALGAGVRIAEIQQNSDTTFRVHDWGRLGLDGRPRAMHVAEALAVLDFTPGGDSVCIPTPLEGQGCRHERLIACGKFTVERFADFTGPVRLDTGGGRFHLLTVVRGEVGIEAAGGTLRRAAWRSALVPAAAGAYRILPGPEAEVLLFTR